ncbi:sugar ABC transporter permease [Tessaracoccus aquimaris]|uniref:Sugar ABC transporter permease n=1 Tax=Tessaracoccus aquimaris TaxID=1332264 RepID=A0A1Q2CLA7_9ACTN|nr:sugar ABC transporter permease [Tessaracoccus aquimaris]AQP46897.1 sugar ABC transporter permease [Tessaracoccus aquimaris]
MSTTTIETGVERKQSSRLRETITALPWLLPTLILIAGVVLYPTVLMIYTSFFKFNNKGIQKGDAPVGLDNYIGPAGALTFPGVPVGRIILNTIVWVVVVVIVTVALSLLLAQFLNKPFRGRKLLRLFIILPWACSVVMTATVFRYGLQENVGLFNRLMVDTGIIETARAWTKDPTSAFWIAVFVAVYVSLPFTTYTILAGLQAVPGDVLEAAHVDGANSVQRYWQIVLPLLRPAIATAALINIINVFNSLPILRLLQETPGYHTGHITTTLMFEYQKSLGPGVSSALSVLNFLFCLVIIAIYLSVVQPTKEVD